MTACASDTYQPSHIPVLAQQCLDLITPTFTLSDTPIVVDATLGLGGHSELILKSDPRVHVIGIDRDPAALEFATTRLADYHERFHPVHDTYNNIDEVVTQFAQLTDNPKNPKVQAVLMDLGVSSMQLDDDERGFAYSRDTELDMRMDTTQGESAYDLLNNKSGEELFRIIRHYGEERFAKRIARAIVSEREKTPITTTGQLTRIIEQAIPAANQRRGGHPAKRTFQAIRIAVNDELTILSDALPTALHTLCDGGRLVVEAYHSLEDRIVKRAMRKVTTVELPDGIPVKAEFLKPDFHLITRKAIRADEQEQQNNPRSASVRLRAVEKNPPADHAADTALPAARRHQ